MAEMPATEENVSDENDEVGRSNMPKYSKSVVSDLFTKLNSCIKERETSQKWFHNLLSSYSGNINKGMNDLIDEVSYLQTQLKQMTRERDDLLVDVEKFCGEIEDLKAKMPHDPLMTRGEKSEHNEDADCEDTNVLQEKLTKAEEHHERNIAQEGFGMTNMKEPMKNTHKDVELNCPDSADSNQKELPDTEELYEGSAVQEGINMGIVNYNNENEVEGYICPHCDFLFSTAEHLKAHMQNTHSELEVCEVSPTEDEDIGAKDHNSKTEKSVNQEFKVSESKTSKGEQLPKVKNHICIKCGYAASQEDLLNLHMMNVHKSGRPKIPKYPIHPIKVPNTQKGRPKRQPFNLDELMRLQGEFEKNPYLNEDRRKNLSKELGRTENYIKSWFDQKRANLHLGNGNKRMPYRPRPNPDQLARLNREFMVNPYLTKEQKKNLSKELGVDKTQISMWFQARRFKAGIKRSAVNQEKDKILTCKQCSYKTSKNYQLKYHVERVHEKIKNQVCEDCGYATYFKQSLKQHMFIVHSIGEGETFSCELCPFTAPTINRLRIHVGEVHEKIRNQVCKECGLGFSRKGDLKRHMICVHKVEEKKFKCELCPIKFISRSKMRTHIQEVHDKIKNHVCEDCGYATYQKHQLNIHRKSIRCQKRGQKIKCEFKCELCPFETHYKGQLERHIRLKICTKPKEYKFCDFCPFKAQGNAALQLHTQAIHEKIRNHVCEKCGYAATQKHALKQHIKNVHGVRGNKRRKQLERLKEEFEESPFLNEQRTKKLAEELGKTKKQIKSWFNTKRQKGEYKTRIYLEEDMTNNQKQKVKQKEYKQCQLCPFKAYSNAIFAFHIQAVHDDIRNLVCQKCGYAASRKSTLSLHMRKVHVMTNKRPHAVFSLEQLARLRQEFEEDPFPNMGRRENLAEEFGKNEKLINNWFTNKRRVDRRRAMKTVLK